MTRPGTLIRLVLIGPREARAPLLEMLATHPGVEIVGVADPGSDESLELLAHSGADIVVDATGDPFVHGDLEQRKAPSAELIGPLALRFLREICERSGGAKALEDKYDLVVRELQAYSDSEFIIGANPEMKELSQLIDKVAPTPITVLVRGESGTGKELVARAIHRRSSLWDRPLVTINCTALAPSLLESELFGHVRGAFTGAGSAKIGLFEKADGGTMFLDEIGDMSLDTQAKVLRTLQTGEIRAVGDVRTKRVSVRVIAATNRDLETAIREGKFREDLFYRINTFTLTLPPLRERLEDIPVLAEHFLRRATAKVNKRVASISPQAIALLQSYDWPGNLRELENIVERAVVLTSTGVIESAHLPLQLQGETTAPGTPRGFMQDRERALHQFERQALARYLSQLEGNVSKAAVQAGLPRRTFYRLMDKHRLSSREFRRERPRHR